MWSTPRTWTAGAVLTAAQLNSNVRDNFNYLRSWAANSVTTSEAMVSGVFGDLATAGPAVTVTTDVQALVTLYCYQAPGSSNQSVMGFTISGATTLAASDSYGFSMANPSTGRGSATFLMTGLTAGSNTFTAKYRNSSGTGSSTFADRRITVMPS